MLGVELHKVRALLPLRPRWAPPHRVPRHYGPAQPCQPPAHCSRSEIPRPPPTQPCPFSARPAAAGLRRGPGRGGSAGRGRAAQGAGAPHLPPFRGERGPWARERFRGSVFTVMLGVCVVIAIIMTTLRAFTCDDLFRFNNINLDPLTETYGIPFYLQYLAHWPEYFIVAEAPGGELMGYIMGKAEGSVAREEWHGHVTALSVAPEFRRLGLAAKLMELLEEISEKKGGFFVDLFVRVSNQVAVNMYKQLGYSVYRTVLEYYSASSGEPDEDAYDMRKALSRDTEKKSVIPLPHPVRPEDIE
ncbi:N-alpha-acetyltransferase 20-like [Haemorhous mexicanus]|nr:N-alpha-acetyltransferase 20-like [Haemorhous mexicanus]